MADPTPAPREPRISCPVDWGNPKPCDVVRNVTKDSGKVVLVCLTCGRAAS